MVYLGTVFEIKDGKCLITQKNKFCVGDCIEIMKPDGNNIKVTVNDMTDENGEHIDSCPHSKQPVWLSLSVMPEVYDILRVESEKA